jgi:DNA invertase Pin-like site-specific DNA recombinase
MTIPFNSSGQPVDNARPAAKTNPHPNAKLTADDVREIRRLFATGVTIDMLTKRFSVTKSTIGNIVNGKSWKHLLT